VVNGPGPGGRYYHTMTLVGSKLFVFGGWTATRCLNDIWAFDLNYCTFGPRFSEPFCPYFSTVESNPFWESYEPAPGNKKPLPRAGHVSVTAGDRIIMFVSLLPSPSPPHYNVCFVDLVGVRTNTSLTILGRLTFRHENGLSYNVLGPFHHPVQVMPLFSSMILCMYMVGIPLVEPS
jgi:hypothetical protein